MDIGTRVELECSYEAGDGWTRSGVASMPKERSGGPRLDQSCDWEKYGYDKEKQPAAIGETSATMQQEMSVPSLPAAEVRAATPGAKTKGKSIVCC